MKFYITAASLFAASFFSAQSIKFEELPMSEILAKAGREGKPVFLDAYASWCGPCKMMERNVFVKKEVADFYNENFINAHLDMEKGEGREIARKYQVYSYPTYLFLNANGEVLYRGGGYLEPDDFISLGRRVANPLVKEGNAKERFEKGEKDPEFLKSAVQLFAATDPEFAKKVSERYFANKKDRQLSREELSMLLSYIRSTNDANYKYFFENKAEITKLLPEEVYRQFNEQILISDALAKAINTSDGSINAGLYRKEIAGKVPADEAEAGLARYEMNFYLTSGNFEKFEETALAFFKDGNGFDPADLVQPAMLISEHSNDAQSLKTASAWLEKSVMSRETVQNTYALAKIYLKTGKKQEARMFAERALQLAESGNLDTNPVKELLNEL